MKTLTLSFLFLFCIVQTHGQDLIPENFEQKREHVEFEIDYYLVAQEDLEKLNDQDKVRLKEIRTERKVQRFIDENENLSSLIQVRSQEQAFADWMDHPEIIYIDEEGISNYDLRGNRIRYVEHSPKYLELAAQFDKNLSENFALPTEEEIRILIRKGILREIGEDQYEIRNGNRKLIFDPIDHFIDEIQYDEEGEILHQLQRSYIELPNGEKYLEMSRERSDLLLSSGVRAQHIILKLYSDQYFESVYSDQRVIQKLKITTINEGSIQVQHKEFEGRPAEAYIFNSSGMLVHRQRMDSMGLSQVDIADLAPGIYILKVTSEGQALSSKFVKR